ncbi:hypothetical protein S40285_05395 [Stachybotrys chlorohalonatus IBT 40285]|uniref:Uncharacterized protein n=1 Tax=Stachybotrys chlorohalonatus (strain IBT 40285) TaxID=1283841 RepID=A0A084QX04_STAC4|nr:hypothetical protein S40285_05395 [Stachybotrys chlorohalonata IBT 40285]
MRLINVDTLALEFFPGQIPPYAILSHTWTSEEVTLQEFGQPDACSKRGWRKILMLCDIVKQASSIKYIWVDTCCIDKTSSAELSEAINAMFQWYRDAEECHAFFDDVLQNEETGVLGDDFEAARWFTRGWTLQELIAPRKMSFWDGKGKLLGTKQDLAHRVAARTRIDEEVLLSCNLSIASVAQKMSWAADRETTRLEDMAYCLLGLFDVNMPMIYGEGDKAFIRLQEEILKETDDHSIFAWDASSIPGGDGLIGVLAPGPQYFRESADIGAYPSPGDALSISNRGIHLDMPILVDAQNIKKHIGVLSCFYKGDFTTVVSIGLREDPYRQGNFSRDNTIIHRMSIRLETLKSQKACLVKRSATKSHGMVDLVRRSCLVKYNDKFEALWGWPISSWQLNAKTASSTLSLSAPPTERVQAILVLRESRFGRLLGVFIILGSAGGRVDALLWELPEAFNQAMPLDQVLGAVEYPHNDRGGLSQRLSAEWEVAVSCEKRAVGLLSPRGAGGMWVDQVNLSYRKPHR